MATYYVATDGDDGTGDGSSGTPWATIAYASTQLSPGDTLLAKNGTYTVTGDATIACETDVSGTEGARIIYRSQNKWGAKLHFSGATPYGWFNNGDYTDIVDFEMTQDDLSTVEVIAVTQRGSYSTVQGCYIHDMGANGIYENYPAGGHDCSVLGNFIYNTGTADPTGYDHGIYCAMPGGVIANNILIKGTGQGIALWHAATDAIIANNLVAEYGWVSGTRGGITIGAGDDPGGVVCDNCIVANNIAYHTNEYGFRTNGALGTNNVFLNNLDYNCQYNGVAPYNSPIVFGHLSNTDPLLLDYQDDGSGDYRLDVLSPCIDAGTATGAPTTDYAGYTRPGGAAVDIGPYESPRCVIPASASLSFPLRTISTAASLAYIDPGLHVRLLPAGTELVVLHGSLSISDRVDQRKTCTFSLLDAAAAYALSERQKIEVREDGTQTFLGFIKSVTTERLPGDSGKLVHVVQCAGERYAAEWRYYQGDEFANERAGSIACQLHAAVLADEGITATYAAMAAQDDFSWRAGATLSNLDTDSAGGLTLSLEGYPIDILEGVRDDFSNGQSLDGVVATTANTLTLEPTPGVYYQGVVRATEGANCYTYRKIWGGTQSIASGDRLHYDIWCPSTSTEAKAGIDLITGDKLYLKNIGQTDQNGVDVSPATDLSDRARDEWYHREIHLGDFWSGKSIKSVLFGMEGDKSGWQGAYVKNVKLVTSGGATKATFFASTLQSSVQVSNINYYEVNCTVVTTYPQTGTRTSPGYHSEIMNYARNSLVQWVVQLPDPDHMKFTMACSISGSPPVECKQNSPLENLPPGSPMAEKTVALVETLAITGPDPTQSPVLKQAHLLINPAYYQDKGDVEDVDNSAATLGAGTLSGLTADGSGLHLTCALRNWDDGSLSGQTLYGQAGGSPLASVSGGVLQIRTGAGYEARLRQDDAGQWQDFVAECDVYITADSTANQGIIFRTESGAWSNSKGYFAYWLWLDNATMKLDKGSGTGTITNIASASGDFATGTWHRLKVKAVGTSIQGYVDDELYIDATDSTHNHTGYLGLGFWNDTAGIATGKFDNFGVMVPAMSGTRQHPSLDASAAGTVYRSLIEWNVLLSDVGSLLVEASTDSGSTWDACTNGGAIPGLGSGIDATGISLLVRETITSGNANDTSILQAVRVLVTGSNQAGGTRLSPTLDLASVGIIGASSVSWDADVPADTTLTVETTLDGGSTWDACTNGGAIPGIADAPALLSDGFDTNTSAAYSFSDRVGSVGALTLYGTNEADGSGCSLVDTLAPTPAEVGVLSTYTGGYHYAEVESHGVTLATGGDSLPDPSGKGWVWRPGATTIASGNYSASITFDGGNYALSSTARLRCYSLIGGVYTSLGSAIVVTLSSHAKTAYTFAATAQAGVTLGANDALYFDLIFYDPADIYGDSLSVYLSDQLYGGLAQHLTITTPAGTIYGTSIEDGTLATACRMTALTTLETSATSTFSGGNYYGEIEARGVTGSTGAANVPDAPSGKGWYFTLDKGIFESGNWSASVTLSGGNYALTSTARLRAFRVRGGDGLLLGQIVVTLDTYTKKTYTFPATEFTLSDAPFEDGDRLGLDLWLHDPANIGGDSVVVYVAASSTQGLAGDLALSTSTWVPGSPSATFTPADSSLTLLAGGTPQTMLYSAAVCRDMTVSAVVLAAPECRLLARYSDGTHYYALHICDDLGGHTVDESGHTLALEVVNGGVASILVAVTAEITRAVPHLVTLSLQGNELRATLDGVEVAAAINAALSSTTGKAGIWYSGDAATVCSLRVEGQGEDVSAGMQVQARLTLSAADPTRTPLIRKLRVEARDSSIASGVIIPATSYRRKKTAAAILDEIANASACFWTIAGGAFSLLDRPDGRVMPWVLTSDDLLGASPPRLIRVSPHYRNRHTLLDALDTLAMDESRAGDGNRRTWPMAYPLDATPTITVDGAPMTVGIAQEQSGKDFYWKRGSNTITQDEDGILLDFANVIRVVYQGQKRVDVTSEDLAQQSILASLTRGSGIVEVVEDAGDLPVSAAIAKADAAIEEYARLALQFACQTARPGAEAGMLCYTFVEEYGLTDVSFFVSEVTDHPWKRADGTLAHTYELTLVSGPNSGTWSRYFALGGS